MEERDGLERAGRPEGAGEWRRGKGWKAEGAAHRAPLPVQPLLPFLPFLPC
jgi:hypothetical protein